MREFALLVTMVENWMKIHTIIRRNLLEQAVASDRV
jgi:hypothetical protein